MACSYKRPQEPSSPTTNCSHRDDGQTIITTRSSACFKVYCSPAAFCQTSGCHCWKTSRLHAEPELPYGWHTCQSNMAQRRVNTPRHLVKLKSHCRDKRTVPAVQLHVDERGHSSGSKVHARGGCPGIPPQKDPPTNNLHTAFIQLWDSPQAEKSLWKQ